MAFKEQGSIASSISDEFVIVGGQLRLKQKSYQALITQASIYDPVLIPSHNSFGEIPAGSRGDLGQYAINTVAGLFAGATTHVQASLSVGATAFKIEASFSDSDEISIHTYDLVGNPVDLGGSAYIWITVD